MARKDIISQNDKKIDNLFTSYTGQIEKSARAIEKQINALLISGVSPADAKIRIQAIFRDSGLFSLFDSYLSIGYQDILNTSFNVYKQLYDKTFNFSEESLDAFTVKKALDLDTFNELSTSAIARINKEIINGVSANLAPVLIDESVAGIMGAFTNHLNVELETSVASVYRSANVKLAEDNGIDLFEYAGPAGGPIRPFCLEHVGQVKTKAAWDALDNGKGQPKPVSEFQGGYRCRHSFVGVLDDEEGEA